MSQIESDRELLDYSNKFDNNVKFLTKIYVMRNKGTFDEESALLSQRRLLTLMKMYPMYIIKTLGPYLLRYGKFIQVQDFDKLLSMNFESDTKEFLQSDAAKKNNTNAKSVSEVMEFVKNIYKMSSKKEREKINETLTDMLSLYAQFAIRVKTISS